MAFSPETYALCQKNTSEQIEEALTSVYNYKGVVDTLNDLPLYGNKIGDIYDVRSEGGQNYGWDGEKWDSLGLNREATDTDLGLIKKKDNTFNTTTLVGNMTAINSDNTNITGSGITSVNGEGNFEVSKPTTILASKTNNIAGEVVNITPSNSMNVTAKSINLTSIDTVIQNNLTVGTAISLGRKEESPVGRKSVALGSSTEASGSYSHAEGTSTVARGISSHAEGKSTEASGDYSHAEGQGTITSYQYQTAIGCFNNNKENNLFEIGNGTESNRNNAFEVDKNGNVIIQNNLNVGGTINLTSLKNLPVWTLDDIQESDEPVNIFKYFLGNSYNDLTTCNRWFIVMPQTSRQFFIGHENKEGVTLSLQLTGEMHLLYFIKTSEKWTITLYNITGKLNGSGTKPSPIIAARSFVEDESGNLSALNTISTFVTSTSGMMDTNYTPSMDRHVVTLKYLNTRIQEFLNNEVTSKIAEELAKINNAEDNTY